MISNTKASSEVKKIKQLEQDTKRSRKKIKQPKVSTRLLVHSTRETQGYSPMQSSAMNTEAFKTNDKDKHSKGGLAKKNDML